MANAGPSFRPVCRLLRDRNTIPDCQGLFKARIRHAEAFLGCGLYGASFRCLSGGSYELLSHLSGPFFSGPHPVRRGVLRA